MSFTRLIPILIFCVYLPFHGFAENYKDAEDLAYFLEKTKNLSQIDQSNYLQIQSNFKVNYPDSPLLDQIGRLGLTIEYNQSKASFLAMVTNADAKQTRSFQIFANRLTNENALEEIVVNFPQWKIKSSIYLENYKKLLFQWVRHRPKDWASSFTHQRFPTNYLNPAWYLYKTGYYSQAETLLKKKSVKSIDRFYYLGVIKYKQQKYLEASKYLQIYLKENPAYSSDVAKIEHWAWYYYYLSLEKQKKYSHIYVSLKKFCEKFPNERYYRILLRVAARAQPKEKEAIREIFFQTFPKSYTTYLENRKKAFESLVKNKQKGLDLLSRAYSGRKQDYRLAKSYYLRTNALGNETHLFLDGFSELYLKNVSDALPWREGKHTNNPFYLNNDEQKVRELSRKNSFYSNYFHLDEKKYRKYLTGRAIFFVQEGYQKEIFKEIEERYEAWEAFHLKKEIYLSGGKHTELVKLVYPYIKKDFENLPYSFLRLAYPKPYKNLVETVGAEKEIDPHLIFAVIRTESHYRPDAISSSGAQGLMQIMPRTGKMLYKTYPLREVQPFNLLRPELNIHLGVTYLSDLSKQFNDEKILMTAAYNGGGGNVRKWNKAFIPVNSEFFIDQSEFGFVRRPVAGGWLDYILRIPFDETERYVQKVIRNWHIYNVIYKKK